MSLAFEHTLTISLPPDEVLRAVARGLASAGFSDVQVNEVTGMITAEKGTLSRWTKGPVAVFVDATPEGSIVKVTSNAMPHGLPLLGKPSRFLVRDAVFAIAAQFETAPG